MKISKERFGTKVICFNQQSYSEIKEILHKAAEKYKNLYVPLDVSKESNGYSFYIAHRQSLKERVTKQGMTVDEFIRLIYRINQLYTECGADFHNVIFDYECVFYGVSIEDTEFVYAPESRSKEKMYGYNRCSDMLCIVSLMIGFSDEGGKETIKDILGVISRWEDSVLGVETSDPLQSFQSVIDYVESKMKRSMDLSQSGMVGFVNSLKQITTRILSAISDNQREDNTETSEEKLKRQRHIIVRGEWAFDNILFDGSTDQIYVGRDPTWADIILGQP